MNKSNKSNTSKKSNMNHKSNKATPSLLGQTNFYLTSCRGCYTEQHFRTTYYNTLYCQGQACPGNSIEFILSQQTILSNPLRAHGQPQTLFRVTTLFLEIFLIRARSSSLFFAIELTKNLNLVFMSI